jgi:hypothetical protein
MNPNDMLILVSNTLEITGLFVYLVLAFRGLKLKITGLEGTISAQKCTIQTLERHLNDLEKWRKTYEILPTGLNKQIREIKKTKDEVIQALKEREKNLKATSTEKDEIIKQFSLRIQTLNTELEIAIKKMTTLEGILPIFFDNAAEEAVNFLNDDSSESCKSITQE